MEAKGFSQSSTRLCTCGSKVPTAYAPTPANTSPIAIHPIRPVAVNSMITNSPKNSSEVPRSRSRTSTPTLSSQIARIGPRTRPGRSRSFQKSRRPVRASAVRLAAK